MNVLAFDTCFGACSAAVGVSVPRGQGAPSRDSDRLFFRYEEMATGHAERLIPMIEQVMEDAGATFSDLDAIAVTEGPGSFTGLRIGIAAARALALATGVPVRAASSLHVMAARALTELNQPMREGALAVCVDARNNQVYAQVFSRQGEALTPPQLLSHDAAASLGQPASLVVVGSGAALVADAARRAGRAADVQMPELLPDARYLAAMAQSLPTREPLVPVYLRAPDAKPQSGKALPRI